MPSSWKLATRYLWTGPSLHGGHEDLALDAGEDAVARHDGGPVLVDGPVQHEGLGGRRAVAHLVEEAVGAVEARVHVVLVEASVFL